MLALLKILDFLLTTIWAWLLPGVVVLILAFVLFDNLRDRYWQRKNRLAEEAGEEPVPEEHLTQGYLSPRRRDGLRRYVRDHQKPIYNRLYQGRSNEPLDHNPRSRKPP